MTFQVPTYSQTAFQIAQRGSSRLATVISRGRLICGVEGSVPGFSFADSQNRYSGLANRREAPRSIRIG